MDLPTWRDLTDILLGCNPRDSPTLAQASWRVDTRAALVTLRQRWLALTAQRGVLGVRPGSASTPLWKGCGAWRRRIGVQSVHAHWTPHITRYFDLFKVIGTKVDCLSADICVSGALS